MKEDNEKYFKVLHKDKLNSPPIDYVFGYEDVIKGFYLNKYSVDVICLEEIEIKNITDILLNEQTDLLISKKNIFEDIEKINTRLRQIENFL